MLYTHFCRKCTEHDMYLLGITIRTYLPTYNTTNQPAHLIPDMPTHLLALLHAYLPTYLPSAPVPNHQHFANVSNASNPANATTHQQTHPPMDPCFAVHAAFRQFAVVYGFLLPRAWILSAILCFLPRGLLAWLLCLPACLLERCPRVSNVMNGPFEKVS